jgi:D-erythronate 2-dehydrogenase
MQITILGGGGFLGRRFAERLAAQGHLGGKPVTGLILFDLAAPKPLEAPFPVTCLGGDVANLADVSAAIPPGTGLVVHLAAVVSAAAEADFDLGMRVNLHGTLAVIEACRKLLGPAIHGQAQEGQPDRGPAPPRLLFTSSVASFGGGQSALLPDDARQVPTNSYGAQKAAAELLLQDASRKGFLDAVSIRLPTVIVRPGRPNKAASSFFSAILREPLLGLTTPLPVGEDFRVWVCSPRRAVDWLFHAAVMDTAPLGVDRGINPPGLAVSVGEMLAALSPTERALVQREPDAAIEAIVGGWPAEFMATRARALGFAQQEGVPEILAAFRADDLAATRADRGL